jgi:hypothetical protein
MARGTSWNFELEVPGPNGGVVYPAEIGEWGAGEEGRIEVADGDRKYKIRDQIFNIDEIPITIYVRKDYDQPGSEYQIMENWCNSGLAKDVVLKARGAGRDPNRSLELQAICYNCELAMGKHSAFNRGSKTVDTKHYFMIPEFVEEMV